MAGVSFCSVSGIVEGLYKGIGYGLGPIISGYLISHLGGPSTFLLFGGVSLVMLGLSFLAQLISRALERERRGKELEYYSLLSDDHGEEKSDDVISCCHGDVAEPPAGRVHCRRQESGRDGDQ